MDLIILIWFRTHAKYLVELAYSRKIPRHCKSLLRVQSRVALLLGLRSLESENIAHLQVIGRSERRLHEIKRLPFYSIPLEDF